MRSISNRTNVSPTRTKTALSIGLPDFGSTIFDGFMEITSDIPTFPLAGATIFPDQQVQGEQLEEPFKKTKFYWLHGT
jgi:hypothetical protein